MCTNPVRSDRIGTCGDNTLAKVAIWVFDKGWTTGYQEVIMKTDPMLVLMGLWIVYCLSCAQATEFVLKAFEAPGDRVWGPDTWHPSKVPKD